MFAIASLPLIDRAEDARVVQSWYADDSAGGGKARKVRAWFDTLQKEGRVACTWPNTSLPPMSQGADLVRCSKQKVMERRV